MIFPIFLTKSGSASCSRRLLCLTSVIATLLLSSFAVAGATPYYQSENALFSMRPDQDTAVTHISRWGPVGISLDLVQPAFTIRIKSIEPGSPAAATGALKPGDFIQTINGHQLHDIDPRIQLGDWITEAEAGDGKLVLKVADKPGGSPREVVVQLEALGTYSESWPLDCPKSERIVRDLANYLKSGGEQKGFADIGMLFLLSTGDASDFEYVKQWARSTSGPGSYPWHLGYGGLALCEYYLRSGDEQVLPKIQRIADKLVEMENFGGWVGRGPIANLSYGGGGGHLNAAGTLCVATLAMAKECGVDIPEESLLRVLTRFFRYSGRGNVPYGMGHPESGFTDNGKNGKLAFAMAAAANLTGKGEDSIYARARDTSALFSFYSTSFMLHGHTGGGIGEIWRSAAMGLMHGKQPGHYREFMDNRRWHYELSRRFDGTFGIVGGGRYDTEQWGIAYALTYTIPRGHLRLAGAPQTQFSKKYALPERPWGSEADDAFQSIQPAVGPGNKSYEIADETLAENAAIAMLRKLRGDVDADTVRKYIHHPSYQIRSIAANAIGGHGVKLLEEFLGSADARVRRAALQGVSKHPEKLLTPEVFAQFIEMIQDPEESWFVKDMAIEAVGKAPADWIVGQVDVLLPFLSHEEWWFQKTALSALAPVAADERVYQKVLPAIGKLMQRNYRYNISGVLRWGTLPEQIRQANPEIQQLARESLQEAYTNFIVYDHPLETVKKRVNPMNREAILLSITKLPGGYDTLYEIGKQESPEVDLPFKQIFLKADPANYSPELKKIVNSAVGGDLIPQYTAKHRKALLKEAGSIGEERGAKMPGLLALYQKVGIDDYNWSNVGPEHNAMEWFYHSFNPPEKWLKPDDRLGRYREVTLPQGMEQWYALDFDPAAAGWRRGIAPFAAADGKLAAPAGSTSADFSQGDDPPNTLWEDDVLLIRSSFDFPELEEGYRYRLLHAGISAVGLGGGYRLYINGKLFIEDPKGVDRREGGKPIGRIIPKEWWSEFEDGPVTLAAISFKKHHPRSKKYGGNISFFMQRMQVPPLEAGGAAESE
jgi:hypothetical protein